MKVNSYTLCPLCGDYCTVRRNNLTYSRRTKITCDRQVISLAKCTKNKYIEKNNISDAKSVRPRDCTQK